MLDDQSPWSIMVPNSKKCMFELSFVGESNFRDMNSILRNNLSILHANHVHVHLEASLGGCTLYMFLYVYYPFILGSLIRYYAHLQDAA